MSIKLDDFMGKYKDFSRTYLFYCSITGAANSWLPRDHVYLVNSSRLPAQTIDDLSANWQGMPYKIASNSTYTDFVINFKNDSQNQIRDGFLKWMHDIHNPKTNLHGAPGDNGGYFGTISLELLNTQGRTIQTYNLIGAWPRSVGELTLDYGSKELHTFDVTFAYQYHVIDGITPQAGSVVKSGL